MRHAKRDGGPHRALEVQHSAPEGSTLDDAAVERILSAGVEHDSDGDPVSGIRNALLASVVFWSAVGLTFAYLL